MSMKSNFMLITFASDEMGETPSSACFVNAIPTPQKNRLITNSIYLLTVSFFDILSRAFLLIMN